MVEAEVIRSRLYVVKTLVNDRTNVLISKSTMRRFDKLKANNQDARTAIRYLEDKTKSGEIKLLTDDFDRSLDVAKAFITSLENSEGVSVLILTANNQPFEKCSDDSGLIPAAQYFFYDSLKIFSYLKGGCRQIFWTLFGNETSNLMVFIILFNDVSKTKMVVGGVFTIASITYYCFK